MRIGRIFRGVALRMVTHLPINNALRLRLAKLGGVDIRSNHVFIGEGVIFDSLYPEEIVIEEYAHVTMNCIVLTHNLDTRAKHVRKWKKGHVHIGRAAFIGANTVICNSVTIGKNSIVGAGSVVTKDIPENEIWGGNPARFIKKRDLE